MLFIRDAKMPEACGTGCTFCRFDQDKDMYRCVFFNGDDVLIDQAALAGERYVNCPVHCELTGEPDELTQKIIEKVLDVMADHDMEKEDSFYGQH